MTFQEFRGAKGGGGGGGGGGTSASHQQADTLRSQDSFETIIGLCEGPIEGLVDGPKSFLVGDTALQAASGTYNFTNFTLNIFSGDDPVNYTITPKLGGLASSTTVGTTTSQNVPLVRQTKIGDIDAIELRINITQLYRQDSSGVYTHTMNYLIEIKPHTATNWCDFDHVGTVISSVRQTCWNNRTDQPRMANGGTTEYLFDSVAVGAAWDAIATTGTNISVSGKTTSPYLKQYRVAVLAIDAPWDIRFTKISANSDGSTNFMEVSWESFQEITTTGIWTWPGTAVAQVVGRASNQFNSLPDFSGIFKGMKVRVPTNYDPIAKTYDGLWDGTFKIAWTDSPPWCVYDLVTNTRYGLSSYQPINMDKWSTYVAAQWCDEKLADGTARYTFNGYIQSPRSVKEQILYMCGSFNAVLFTDQNGTAYLRVDKDEDAIQIYASENTIDGFSYSFTDVTSRYNDISVTFNNPDLNWQEDRRKITDQDLINSHGRITHDFIAVGCIYEKEALRRAKYKMETANTETMLCNFKTNRQGLFTTLYDVILIADEDLGYGVSGRIDSLDATRTIITLRDPIYLEVGGDYSIQITLPNGLMELAIINATSGYNYTLQLAGPIHPAVVEKAVFAISQTGSGIGLPKPFRVVKISEIDGSPDNIEIHCIEVNRNKWYNADNLADVPEPVYSFLPDPTIVPGPNYVAFKEYFVPQSKAFHLLVEPDLDRTSYRYYSGDFEVWSRPQGMVGNGGFQKQVLSIDNSIVNHPPGDYEFRIIPINFLGQKAEIEAVSSFNFRVANPKDPPSNVQSLIGYVNTYGINLDWAAVSDIDTNSYELRYGDTFEDSVVLTTLSALHFSTGVKTAGEHTFWVRAVDFLGYKSVTPTSCVVTINPPAAPILSATTVGPNVIFSWTVPETTFALDRYLLLEGDTLETATPIASAKATTFSMAVSWAGSKRFWVVAYDIANNDSAGGSVDVFITPPGQTTISIQTIDNNVLIRWVDVVSQLPVSSYEIRRSLTGGTRQTTLTFTNGETAINPGDIVIGETSGAMGVVQVVTITSGNWVGGNAAGTVLVNNSFGNFTNGEDIVIRSNSAFSNGYSIGFD